MHRYIYYSFFIHGVHKTAKDIFHLYVHNCNSQLPENRLPDQIISTGDKSIAGT